MVTASKSLDRMNLGDRITISIRFEIKINYGNKWHPNEITIFTTHTLTTITVRYLTITLRKLLFLMSTVHT